MRLGLEADDRVGVVLEGVGDRLQPGRGVVGYTALGMQGALDAVRSTGATRPVTASGIDYANNLSQWLAYRPSDPANPVHGRGARLRQQRLRRTELPRRTGRSRRGRKAWMWDTSGNRSSLISSFDGTPANAYGTFVRDYYLAH